MSGLRDRTLKLSPLERKQLGEQSRKGLAGKREPKKVKDKFSKGVNTFVPDPNFPEWTFQPGGVYTWSRQSGGYYQLDPALMNQWQSPVLVPGNRIKLTRGQAVVYDEYEEYTETNSVENWAEQWANKQENTDGTSGGVGL